VRRRCFKCVTGAGVIAAVVVAVLIQSCDHDRAATPEAPCLAGLVPLEDLDVLPVLLHRAAPDYPRSALRDGWSGSGTSFAIINTDGSLCDCGMAASSGRDDIDASILDSTWTAVFAPGFVDSAQVRCRVEMTLTFTIGAAN